MTGGRREVLLVHPGGPFWQRRNAGAWQIPKGAIEPGETPEAAALREFEEELGARPEGPLVALGRIRQAGGKSVEAFVLEGDFDPARLESVAFELEWPPRSGRFEHFPEVDEARWFTLAEARAMILASQAPLIDRLEEVLAG